VSRSFAPVFFVNVPSQVRTIVLPAKITGASRIAVAKANGPILNIV
jgi:hypothetical protein